jgi:hypothetical protein
MQVRVVTIKQTDNQIASFPAEATILDAWLDHPEICIAILADWTKPVIEQTFRVIFPFQEFETKGQHIATLSNAFQTYSVFHESPFRPKPIKP